MRRSDHGTKSGLPLASAVHSAYPEQLLHRDEPKVHLNQLLLPEEANEMVPELIEEQHRANLLRASGIELMSPRNSGVLVNDLKTVCRFSR